MRIVPYSSHSFSTPFWIFRVTAVRQVQMSFEALKVARSCLRRWEEVPNLSRDGSIAVPVGLVGSQEKWVI